MLSFIVVVVLVAVALLMFFEVIAAAARVALPLGRVAFFASITGLIAGALAHVLLTPTTGGEPADQGVWFGTGFVVGGMAGAVLGVLILGLRREERLTLEQTTLFVISAPVVAIPMILPAAVLYFLLFLELFNIVARHT